MVLTTPSQSTSAYTSYLSLSSSGSSPIPLHPSSLSSDCSYFYSQVSSGHAFFSPYCRILPRDQLRKHTQLHLDALPRVQAQLANYYCNSVPTVLHGARTFCSCPSILSVLLFSFFCPMLILCRRSLSICLK
jgi:hypothetical protein